VIARSGFAAPDVQRAVSLVSGFRQGCFAFAPPALGALRTVVVGGSLTQASIAFLTAGVSSTWIGCSMIDRNCAAHAGSDRNSVVSPK
jgi:hypothetical protein